MIDAKTYNTNWLLQKTAKLSKHHIQTIRIHSDLTTVDDRTTELNFHKFAPYILVTFLRSAKIHPMQFFLHIHI